MRKQKEPRNLIDIFSTKNTRHELYQTTKGRLVAVMKHYNGIREVAVTDWWDITSDQWKELRASYGC